VSRQIVPVDPTARGIAAYDNVIVLGTGRCGTTTFIEACDHLTNYSAAHESRARRLPPERFAYPVGHIEADNRLTWFLPMLEEAMSGRKVLYVHLQRERDAVARSYLKRINNNRASIMKAFAYAIVMHPRDWEEDELIDVARFYVDTVTANIASFLRDKEHVSVWLETASQDFPAFLDRIGAEGDLDAALAEWDVSHNASRKA
jgi:hypothetical protein